MTSKVEIAPGRVGSAVMLNSSFHISPLNFSAQILNGLEELEFPQTSQYMDIFNDTSIHWFPAQKLEQLPPDTWAFREEPDYQDCKDLEIIRNKTGGLSAIDLNSL